LFRELAPAFEIKGEEPLNSSECARLLQRLEGFSGETLRALLVENDELTRKMLSSRQTLRESGLDFSG
jgi:hypothetical protein